LKKVYVLDTNIIIDDPYITDKIKAPVFIPTTVLQELDFQKSAEGLRGYNIREFTRLMSKKNKKNVQFFNSLDFEGTPDRQIIKSAQELSKTHEVILLSNDLLMGALAEGCGIKVKRHNLLISQDDAYTGISYEDDPKHPNQYQITKSGIYKLNGSTSIQRIGKDRKIWGITHKNAEQKCLIDALMDDNIKLVTISGRAGTGKTLLSIAAALEKVMGENKYERILVARPIIPMGQDIGYLPGDKNEKIAPWMQPIFDNIDFLFNNGQVKKKHDQWKILEEQGVLQLEVLTYIRGRSIPNQFIIIDEAQNTTPHEVKTILSRAGDNTKVIFTGDPDQIDNPKLCSKNNGLTYLTEKFKKYSIAAHITLCKGERSELAELAAEIL